MAYAELVSRAVDGVEEDIIRVNTTWAEKELIKLIPGARWNAKDSVWELPLGWAQCIIMRGVFRQQITFGDRLTKWGWDELNGRINPIALLRNRITPDSNEILPGFAPTKPLYDFQTVGVQFMVNAGDLLLGDEMGTGKTVQALCALRHLHQRGDDVLPTVIVAPNSTKLNWEKETRTWFPEAEPVVISGSAKAKRDAFTANRNVPNAIFIINIESVRLHSRLASYGSVRLKRCKECDPKYGSSTVRVTECEVHPKELNSIPLKTFIIDEAHRIKDPKSKQTRACWSVANQKTVTHRWAMTGTPVANHPADLWSIMRCVAPYEYPSRTRFIDRYCLTAWNAYGGLDVVGVNPEHKDEFYKILDPRFRCMPKALVLKQLPPKVRQWRHVEMSPKQSKAYKEMEQTLITRLDDGNILVAPNNLAAQVRLLQLSSSYCEITPDPTTPSGIRVLMCDPSPKVDEFEAILGDLAPDEKVVACAMSKQLIMLTSKRLTKLKIPHGLITGDQTQWERQEALRRLQEGTDRVLLFTVQAGGTGLTMTAASTIVFLQRDWSMINNKQAEDRVHRIGSEVHETINIIDIVTRGTVEEHQIIRLYDKLQRLEEITRTKETLRLHGLSTAEMDAEEAKILNSNLGAL